MDGCTQICKCFLILSNILLVLVGFGLAALGTLLGIVAAVTGLHMKPLTIGVTVLVITGILTMLVAVIGNYGAFKHSKAILYGFSGLLSLLIIFDIVAGVMAFVRAEPVSDELVEFYNTVYTQYPDTDIDRTPILKLIHKIFDCCGIGEPIKQSVEFTCPDNLKHLSFPSCPTVIQNKFHSYAPLVLGGFLGLAGIRILALVCGVVLSRRISQCYTAPSEDEARWAAMHENCIRTLCCELFQTIFK